MPNFKFNELNIKIDFKLLLFWASFTAVCNSDCRILLCNAWEIGLEIDLLTQSLFFRDLHKEELYVVSWPKSSRSVQKLGRAVFFHPWYSIILLTGCGDESLVITKEKAKFGDFISMLTAFLDFAADLGYNLTYRVFTESLLWRGNRNYPEIWG